MAENLTPLMQALLDCVVEKLIAIGRPACEACLVAGNTFPPLDGCDCTCDEGGNGRAWIRIRAIEFDAHLNSASVGKEVVKCPTGAWNVRLEAGVSRCIKDLEGRCADKLTDAIAMNEDLSALVVAIHCCPELTSAIWAPETASPLGPDGGCVAALYNFVVQLPRLR